MSESVDVVMSLIQVWEEEGFGVVPELMDREIEYVNPHDAVESGVRHGHEGFAAAARAALSIYTEFQVVPITFYEAGDSVAVVARLVTLSRGNSVPVEATRGYVFDVRNGKVKRFAWFNQPREALADLGLEG